LITLLGARLRLLLHFRDDFYRFIDFSHRILLVAG
jgi:hypothetical protein